LFPRQAQQFALRLHLQGRQLRFPVAVLKLRRDGQGGVGGQLTRQDQTVAGGAVGGVQAQGFFQAVHALAARFHRGAHPQPDIGLSGDTFNQAREQVARAGFIALLQGGYGFVKHGLFG